MKLLDIEAVQAFVHVADLKSFTRAAEAISSSQSAIGLPTPTGRATGTPTHTGAPRRRAARAPATRRPSLRVQRARKKRGRGRAI